MTFPQMTMNFICFDCAKPFEYSNETKSSSDASELLLPDLENEEIDKKIIEIDSKQDFHLKTSICLNCIDKYSKLIKKNNQSVTNEKELIIQAMKNLLVDINSKELIDITDNSRISLLQKKQKELALIQQEQKKYNKTTSELTRQLNTLIKEEEDFWNEINTINIEREENDVEDLIETIQYDHIKKKAESLLKPIRLSDLFKIEIINRSAFINDFALEQSKFNINEINFSIGQLAYLISIMGDRVGYSTEKYSIYSIGKRSRILDKGQKKLFDLFLASNSNQDISLFNEGLKVFLTSIFELIRYINNSYKMAFNTKNDNNLNAFRFSIEGLANWSVTLSEVFEIIKNIIQEPKLQLIFNTQFN